MSRTLKPRHIEILNYLFDGEFKTHHQIAEVIYKDINKLQASYAVCKTLLGNGYLTLSQEGKKSEVRITVKGKLAISENDNLKNPEEQSSSVSDLDGYSDRDLFSEILKRGYVIQINNIK
jgi:hypothetical protein